MVEMAARFEIRYSRRLDPEGPCHGNRDLRAEGCRGVTTAPVTQPSLPMRHSFRPEQAQRAAADQMTRKIEGVLSGGMHYDETLSGSADLKRCIFRSRRRTA
jgi:hypothetical protein